MLGYRSMTNFDGTAERKQRIAEEKVVSKIFGSNFHPFGPRRDLSIERGVQTLRAKRMKVSLAPVGGKECANAPRG
jgi:hypothetical protein